MLVFSTLQSQSECQHPTGTQRRKSQCSPAVRVRRGTATHVICPLSQLIARLRPHLRRQTIYPLADLRRVQPSLNRIPLRFRQGLQVTLHGAEVAFDVWRGHCDCGEVDLVLDARDEALDVAGEGGDFAFEVADDAGGAALDVAQDGGGRALEVADFALEVVDATVDIDLDGCDRGSEEEEESGGLELHGCGCVEAGV